MSMNVVSKQVRAAIVAVGVAVGAVVAVGAGPVQADPQATIPISCDRPNTGISGGLLVNLNTEIPDPLNSDSLMQVVDVDPVVSGRTTHVELNLPFPDLAGGFPPNDFGVTYGTFYIKSVTITVPIPAGYDLTTVTPSESPDKSYVTVTRSGSNLVAVVQSPVSGSRIRINTEVASPVAEVETSSGVWTPVVMPTIVLNPTVTASAGSTITWRPPSSSNLVVKWNRNFNILIGQINWNDLAMLCTPVNANQVVATTTVATPALSVSATADETSVVAGATAHLHVTVTNTGDIGLTGVVVTDANAPGCGGNVGNLAVGAHVTLDCSVTTTPANVPTLSNSAVADANETTPVTSNTVNVTVTPAGPTGVSGTVTEQGTGDPVAGAWMAFLRSSNFSVAGGAQADGSGNYSAQLPAGTYYAYVVDPAGRHAAGFHGPPTPVGVTAGSMTDVDPVVASTRGSISGTITEQGTGTPLVGSWAFAINGSTGAPETGVPAGAGGQYAITDLPAGDHYVIYLDPSGAHAPEYFENSSDVTHATRLGVSGGGTATANGTPVAQTPVGGGSTISGIVTETGTNADVEGVTVIALRASDFRFAASTRTNAQGEYTLSVAPGQYKLAFLDGSGAHFMEWFDGQTYVGLASAAPVTAPGTASAILDRSTGALEGVVTEQGSGTPLAGVWAVAIGPSGIAGGAVTDTGGHYDIPGLPAGTYRVTFADPVAGHVQEYWNNSPDFAGSSPVVVAGGSSTSIDAALAAP